MSAFSLTLAVDLLHLLLHSTIWRLQGDVFPNDAGTILYLFHDSSNSVL